MIDEARCVGISSCEVMNDDQAIEVQRLASDLESALSGATDNQIARMIGQMALIYPMSKLSAAEARARLDLYIDLLSDIPVDVLTVAFREVAKTSRFFPTVAEIRAETGWQMEARHRFNQGLQTLLRRHREDREPSHHDRRWAEAGAARGSEA